MIVALALLPYEKRASARITPQPLRVTYSPMGVSAPRGVRRTGGRDVGAEMSRAVSWVDTGRGLAIMLVVLYHSANWFAVPAWQSANSTVSTFRMPLFFAISGMFAGKWLAASWSDLWRAKISLFTWVVLVWSAIGVAVLRSGCGCRAFLTVSGPRSETT